MTVPSVGAVLQSFLIDHLKVQRGLRQTTIRSYRDSIRLYLQFISKTTGKPITRLSLHDLTCERVLAFLKLIEETRKNSARTRNQRLAALHTFYKYLAGHVPELLFEAERVAAIPTKRAPPSRTFFLEQDEINTLFKKLPRTGRNALRDLTLLLFLYNTGARVQEAADLRIENLDLGNQPRVRLHGKGDKWRACPLWRHTADNLRQLIKDFPQNSPVFVSDGGQALTRFGIYKIVRRLTANLRATNPSGQRQISPHLLRHTCAVHLLESGVEVNVIRSWLGHVSLDTTNRYAEINMRMKNDALKACQPPDNANGLARIKWRDDETLLKWLQSL